MHRIRQSKEKVTRMRDVYVNCGGGQEGRKRRTQCVRAQREKDKKQKGGMTLRATKNTGMKIRKQPES